MNERRTDHNGGEFAPRRGFRDSDRPSPHPPPEVGSIWEGKIQRIQPYGAFCSFGPLTDRGSRGQHPEDPHQQRRVWQGLIHISQLTDTRVEKVEDVVDIDDIVWVKILEVEKQPSDQHTNTRYRIKLSMKDVSQDGTGQDLGREREQKEQVTTQLQTNLNSMIGMGVALDPMERLVLKQNSAYGSGKGNASSTKTTFRGGYTLVGDDEGEPEPDPSAAATDTANNSYRTAPMGRGRGATLPAWMTSSEGPAGASGDKIRSKSPGRKVASDDKPERDRFRDDYSDDDYSDDDDNDHSRRRSSSKKEKMDRKRHKKKSRHRRHKRSYNYSDDESSDSSHSRHRRRHDDERRHRKRHKSSRRHRRKDRKSSSKRKDKRERKRSRQDNASISDSGSSYSSR